MTKAKSIPIRKLRLMKGVLYDLSHGEEVELLVNSIQKEGVRQPIIVRRGAWGIYEIVDGIRRYHAAGRLGIKHIPAVVKRMSRQEADRLRRQNSRAAEVK